MTRAAAPVVRRLALPPPGLKDNTADADRLLAALKRELNAEAIDIDPALIRPLPAMLRQTGYAVRVVLGRDRRRWFVAAVAPADTDRPAAGLAVDIGTTTIELRLLDLERGGTLGELAFENPQTAVAPDVLARIHHADTEAGLAELNRLVVQGLNQGIGRVAERAGIAVAEIACLAVAGNTAMTHLLLGLDPRGMIREPYIPVLNRPGVLRAADLGLKAGPGARVTVFPNVGSYFGGDLIAGILFSGLHRREEPAILVDVGTNAEVVLGNRDWLIGCAGAAGPALEGGMSRIGMAAGPGAIDRVVIDPQTRRFTLRTIGGLPPRGICGSGMIDLAAQLFLAGMIDLRGKLVPAACAERLVEVDGVRALTVVPAAESATGEALLIGQPELDSLVRSKAAMYTILETLTLSVGLALEQVETVLVAGTFGTHIDPRSAVVIGMLPDLPPERYVALGNTALAGAALALLDPDAADAIDPIRDRVTYLELNVNAEFMNRFSAAKFLPHTDAGRFPSVPRPR